MLSCPLPGLPLPFFQAKGPSILTNAGRLTIILSCKLLVWAILGLVEETMGPSEISGSRNWVERNSRAEAPYDSRMSRGQWSLKSLRFSGFPTVRGSLTAQSRSLFGNDLAGARDGKGHGREPAGLPSSTYNRS